MTITDRWQLPDGVDELLPERAAALESLRRRLLDLYRGWGYQLVIPPLMEFTDSLLEGVGADLDILTFKMPDQPSGRTLGLRADITPQVARIDAHSLADDGVSRLCYTGATLHTRPKSALASRAPIQAGAEIFGEASLAADIEVIELMLMSLEVAGVVNGNGRTVTLDLGHGDVCAAIFAKLAMGAEQQAAVFDALQRKSRPDLEIALHGLDAKQREPVLLLLNLHGDASVLGQAEAELAPLSPAVGAAVASLRAVAGQIAARHPTVEIYFDLAELRGYHYHTGIVFAAYLAGYGEAVANGGRYDNVGRAYGRARPATGFATDLKALVQLQELAAPPPAAIAAPALNDAQLRATIARLRAGGEVVISSLAGERDPRCTRELALRDGMWDIVAINPN